MRLRRTSKEEKPATKPKDESPFLQTYGALGFDPEGTTGKETFGECPLCGGKSKFYVNRENGLFSCKRCGEEGNVNTFLQLHYKQCKADHKIPKEVMKRISSHRSLPMSVLIDAGLYWDGDRYGFPVRNSKGNIVSFRRFRMADKIKVMGLAGVGAYLWGVERVKADTKRVFVCEGEWDCLAFRQFLIEQGFADQLDSNEWAVVCVPGAGIWKQDWYKLFEDKDVVLIYDNDGPGERGRARVFEHLGGGQRFSRRKVEVVNWPTELPQGFDFRDFYKAGGTWDLFQEMLSGRIDVPASAGSSDEEEQPKITVSGERPSYDEVLAVFNKWLLMTPEHEKVLRIVMAVILSNQLPGDPLWLHVVGSPGSGKTEILMAMAGFEGVVARSSITARSLISGHHGARDASLIPRLIGNTFILKDFTEVLQMPRTDRDQVYSVLRGAYDGHVYRDYGNGVIRDYEGYFSMIAGVTHAIDGDSDASMGDRFLKFRMEDQKGQTRRNVIMEALKNVGTETTMKEELQEVCARFLTYEAQPSDIPDVPLVILERIVALAELVSVLRASVERDTVQRDRIKFRPHPEIGTRIAKQMKRLLLGLALEHNPPRIVEADFSLMAEVAIHTGSPFQLEIIRWLIEHPGQQPDAISKALNIPMTTLRESLDNMHLLGMVEKRQDEEVRRGLIGRRPNLWSVTSEVDEKWKQAGL